MSRKTLRVRVTFTVIALAIIAASALSRFIGGGPAIALAILLFFAGIGYFWPQEE